MKKINYYLLLLTLLLSVGVMKAAAPAGYYQPAEGLSQKALLQKLCTIIQITKTEGYANLWTMYKTTDIVPGTTNQIWDMYSTVKWTAGTQQCGSNNTYVGGCYNREHSMPKSWFGGSNAEPMHSDAHHIFPTDAKVNAQRSNYPYGECANGTTLTGNGVTGLGKLGACTFPGYSGTVFEPVDEYKGDFARAYFYMAACYNDKIATWTSDMLAKNNYPCYTSWAVELLLKWHRLDPVSEKEINRNDAVQKSGHQDNRNPFVDHPELAEHIWGNKQSIPWKAGGGSIVVTPTLTSPANGTVVEMGIASVNQSLTKTITVKGANLTKDLKVAVSGAGFSVNATTVTAANANAGQDIIVTYKSSVDANANGTLTVSSTEVNATVTLKAQAVSTIPALAATNVKSTSFSANWSDVHKDGGDYQLSVYDSSKRLLAGYPKTVKSAAASFAVTGLTANTTYYYDLSRGSLKSNQITVVTPDLTRSISGTIAGGSLAFTSTPQTVTEPIAVDIHTENITENVTVDITGEFEISTDKVNWASTLSISNLGERIYVRMKALANGAYAGLLVAYTSTVRGFEFDVTGNVTDAKPFWEDFEPKCQTTSYNTTAITYQGTACKWKLHYVGIFVNRASDHKNGLQCICTNKTASNPALIEMVEDKPKGMSSLSFMAALYGTDTNPGQIKVSYSEDQGATYTELGIFDITGNVLKEYSVDVSNKKIWKPVRVRFERLKGARMNIDDVKIVDTTVSSGVDALEADNAWDAYCSTGKLVVETQEDALIYVYNLEAETVFKGVVCGTEKIELSKGVYVVVNGDNSRKVIVK